MIRELDTVVLTHDLAEKGLQQGDLGAVVHCHPQSQAYEVEFVTAEGETVALLTLTPKDIRPVQSRDMLHVRELLPACA